MEAPLLPEEPDGVDGPGLGCHLTDGPAHPVPGLQLDLALTHQEADTLQVVAPGRLHERRTATAVLSVEQGGEGGQAEQVGEEGGEAGQTAGVEDGKEVFNHDGDSTSTFERL